MERSLTIDLPVEQVAKVVKRHLIFQPNPLTRQPSDHYTAHHQLPGGAVVDEIYKWTARIDSTQQRRERTQSISLPATRTMSTDPLLQSLKQPGGFRRYHLLTQAQRQGKTLPNIVTSSFVEFLCLYGHFGGEDLSDDDSSESDTSQATSYESSDEGSGTAYPSALLHTNTSSLSLLPSPATSNAPNNNSTAQTQASQKGHQPIHYRHLHARETMPLLSRSRPGHTLQGKATPGKAMFLLLKSFVTTGIMFLPKAFDNGGLVFSMVGIVVLALVCYWSFMLLVQTRLVVPASFGDMGGVLYGQWMRTAVLVAITLSQIGFVCAYMIFVAENLQSLVLAFSKCRVLMPMHLLILAQSFAFIPLAMIRKIQRLSVFALIGDVFIVIGLGYLFYYDMRELVHVGSAPVVYWNPLHFPLFIGTAVFTFEGVGLVIPITESMKDPQKFPMVLKRALFFIALLFVSMSALSYLVFGDHVKTIILLNLPSKDPVVSSIQLLYSLAICLSIPLQLFPAIRIMENGLFTTRSGKNNAIVKWQKNVFRVLVVFLCAWIAIVGSKDKLDKFVSLVGALFCMPLCFVFPPLFHLKALSLPLGRQCANIVLMAVGVFGMVTVTVLTLQQWNSSESLDPTQECISHRT
ncbi:transmembrane amino acid transporter protein-domain-containing protein [Spinellus fusiger]|nr:transmembrane amino acid transporter protein-domain-containing protein [Spinellus fusiger]